MESRRRADFVVPIPAPKKRKGAGKQDALLFDERSTQEQLYDHTAVINAMRQEVDKWRALPSPNDWRVTPETARLLQHWRHHVFSGVRPFFCQIEAVEAAIWLTEVAPQLGKTGERFIEHLANANHDANPGLNRLALKLATGAGKTSVMAMLIAWQTVDAVSRPQASREIVPRDMLDDLNKAKIVITNYHSFKLRERVEISKGGRQLLQGRTGDAPETVETDGQMLQRVCPELMGLPQVMVLNDEAHHCYREKPKAADETATDEDLSAEDKQEAQANNEAARLWINGIEAVQRKLGVARVMDLSATPFFLRGSGYAEGTLFPWTMSDFSLMDAIECGIVKLPHVPIADNIPGGDMPMYRDLWKHIGKQMPKKGRASLKKGAAGLDPLKLPTPLITALEALYGHYAKTYELWQRAGINVPPCAGLSRGTARRPRASRIRRRLHPGADTRHGGRRRNAQQRHHRRAGGPELQAPG